MFMNNHTSVASLVRRHVKLNSAQRILEAYSAGESFGRLLDELSPEQRREAEGLLRAAAESWGNAVTASEAAAQGDGALWLR